MSALRNEVMAVMLTSLKLLGTAWLLRMGFRILRPWGNMLSVRVHSREIPWSGNGAYAKNSLCLHEF
ncbi:hypothetical protein EDB80DRAFT_699385 [Ilyonectria destructans]|nr:hypothetical protein EDB80DRAFT_699385 [Ilyonectria destructans]